jgi:hypothetical protein
LFLVLTNFVSIQSIYGLTLAQFDESFTTNTNTVISTIAASMGNSVSTGDISITKVTDVRASAAFRLFHSNQLRILGVKPLTVNGSITPASGVTILYSVSVPHVALISSVYTAYKALTGNLTEAIRSGRFDRLLHRFAKEQGAKWLFNATALGAEPTYTLVYTPPTNNPYSSIAYLVVTIIVVILVGLGTCGCVMYYLKTKYVPQAGSYSMLSRPEQSTLHAEAEGNQSGSPSTMNRQLRSPSDRFLKL